MTKAAAGDDTSGGGGGGATPLLLVDPETLAEGRMVKPVVDPFVVVEDSDFIPADVVVVVVALSPPSPAAERWSIAAGFILR